MHYVFNHIPKCGGSSVIHVLKNWGEIVYDYSNEIDKSIVLTKNQILCGHYLPIRYPVLLINNQISIFSFIREPLSLRISLYYYHRNRNRFLDLTLDEYIQFVTIQYPNLISSCLGCNEDNYVSIINKYLFIGLYEELQESFNILCFLANKSKITLPRINVSDRDNQNIHTITKSLFKKENLLDYEVYLYCKKIYQTKWCKILSAT